MSEIFTKPRKNSLFGCPPIPPSTKWRPTIFWYPKTPKTSRTYPKWEGVLNLMGQKRQGRTRYGELIADDMIFIRVKFQDLPQKRAPLRRTTDETSIFFKIEVIFTKYLDLSYIDQNRNCTIARYGCV